MQGQIQQKLKEIERAQGVRILHAVESGSRAWGFASTDSDYDVRFIYVRPLEDYLKLEGQRDVIELPIEGELDINGWDLQKALRLVFRTNPTLYDWMASTTIYRQTGFAEQLRPLLPRYFSPLKGVYHYLRMAEKNYRIYLENERVQAKKYFYVLRPVLACRWIMEQRTAPPILFSELVETQLDAAMKPLVEHLLDIKMNTPEVKDVPQLMPLNEYLRQSIASLREKALLLEPVENPGWEPLDRLFRAVVLGA